MSAEDDALFDGGGVSCCGVEVEGGAGVGVGVGVGEVSTGVEDPSGCAGVEAEAFAEGGVVDEEVSGETPTLARVVGGAAVVEEVTSGALMFARVVGGGNCAAGPGCGKIVSPGLFGGTLAYVGGMIGGDIFCVAGVGGDVSAPVFGTPGVEDVFDRFEAVAAFIVLFTADVSLP